MTCLFEFLILIYKLPYFFQLELGANIYLVCEYNNLNKIEYENIKMTIKANKKLLEKIGFNMLPVTILERNDI